MMTTTWKTFTQNMDTNQMSNQMKRKASVLLKWLIITGKNGMNLSFHKNQYMNLMRIFDLVISY